jgi:hypothetical protein
MLSAYSAQPSSTTISSLSLVVQASLAPAMTHQQIKAYCLARLNEAKPIITNGTPWGFLCVAAYVDFLAKLAWNKDEKSKGYKDFFKLCFPDSYNNFTFSGGQKDLPEQFYHVLRCGICHSFSLVPDVMSQSSGGRSKSVIISHDGLDTDGTAYSHLDNYTKHGYDAAILLGGNLCDDLTQVVCNMFSDHSIQSNAEAWVAAFPPIGGI